MQSFCGGKQNECRSRGGPLLNIINNNINNLKTEIETVKTNKKSLTVFNNTNKSLHPSDEIYSN